jgi:hypothetical protein
MDTQETITDDLPSRGYPIMEREESQCSLKICQRDEQSRQMPLEGMTMGDGMTPPRMPLLALEDHTPDKRAMMLDRDDRKGARARARKKRSAE